MSTTNGQLVDSRPVVTRVPSSHPHLKHLETVVLPRIAGKNTTVLITGESGTGKEGIARRIHALGPRQKKPYLAVNCPAIPEALHASRLFGHEKGAFTGADSKKPGYFGAAQGGVLVLDEVARLDRSAQLGLLRPLQEREIEPVGAVTSVPIDVQIVATTNCDLRREVRQGRFCEDLLYRLSQVTIYIPPLRDRPDDIEPLFKHYSQMYGEEYGLEPLEMDGEMRRTFRSYHWPGNVRQLMAVIVRAYALGERPSLEEEITNDGPTDEQRLPTLRLRELTALAIGQALALHNGDSEAAAEELGISFKTLRQKRRELKGLLG